ncbi:MAG: MBL fold metallo-hydrolase [Lachnospiraceae bacterium]|nr:MBL fold metallo-hydrolase [Lachnospiraceae bacterium]
MRDFFSATKISERLYIIRESYCDQDGFTLGLVIGDEKAVVIDSGLGAVDGLRRFAESLTDKPLICLVTHGHPDHAGGAILFDKSYMSSQDDKELVWGLTRERRLGDLKDFCRNDPEVEAYAAEHCVDCTGYTYEKLKDKQVFDLGGVKLEALAMPGHTKGSYIFINHEDEYIFTGDAVSETLMVTSYERSAMEDSCRALERLVRTAQGMSHPVLYAAHYAEPVDLQIAIDLRDACVEVLAGKTDKDTRTHFKYAELNDPNIVLYKHVAGQVSVTYNAAILQQNI